jgi:hypothetical protein
MIPITRNISNFLLYSVLEQNIVYIIWQVLFHSLLLNAIFVTFTERSIQAENLFIAFNCRIINKLASHKTDHKLFVISLVSDFLNLVILVEVCET